MLGDGALHISDHLIEEGIAWQRGAWFNLDRDLSAFALNFFNKIARFTDQRHQLAHRIAGRLPDEIAALFQDRFGVAIARGESSDKASVVVCERNLRIYLEHQRAAARHLRAAFSRRRSRRGARCIVLAAAAQHSQAQSQRQSDGQ